MVGILKAEEYRNGGVINARDRVHVVVLGCCGVELHDFNSTPNIECQEVIRIVRGIPHGNILINLIGSEWCAVLPIVLLLLEPVAKGSQEKPPEHHDKHHHAHKNHPMEPAVLWRAPV